MSTLEHIKEKIMADAAKKIADAEKECTIREQLQIQPRYVHVYSLYTCRGTIKYEVKTKSEAWTIVEAYQAAIQPSYLCKCSSGTSVKCFDDETAKEVTEHYAGLHISQHNASIEFFTLVNDEPWRVAIEMPVHLFGSFRKDYPNNKTNYKLYFKPSPLTAELHRIAHYAGYGRGAASFTEEIFAMYEPYELERQLEEGTL